MVELFSLIHSGMTNIREPHRSGVPEQMIEHDLFLVRRNVS